MVEPTPTPLRPPQPPIHATKKVTDPDARLGQQMRNVDAPDLVRHRPWVKWLFVLALVLGVLTVAITLYVALN